MAETKQINATVPADVVNVIVEAADAEKRSFSFKVAEILEEWANAKKQAENGSKEK